MTESQVKFHTIVLPVRPQPDTIAAIFILKRYGNEVFPGVKEAKTEFWPTLSNDKTSDELFNEGYVLIDLGSGIFDHHNKEVKTTASELVVQYLDVADDPTLAKLLEYARRDDFYGKGTISEDPIDRAFGLSALIAVLNKSLPKNPEKVIAIVMPLLIAHHNEEKRRFKEFPEELNQKRNEGKVLEFAVKQRGKKLKVIMIESSNVGMPGFLRSQIGGKHDVVVQRTNDGYVNILTRPAKRIDLRVLASLIRIREADKRKIPINNNVTLLMQPGRNEDVSEWYYDRATNSILNGGLIPSADVRPTQIGWTEEMSKILELGLAEQIFSLRN